MNVLLWVLQVALALQSLAGGAFKVFKYDDIANMPATKDLPRAGWTALGVLEMVCGVLLIVPAATHWMPMLTPLAAAVLALESLALAALYARHSTRLTSTNPLVYVMVSAIIGAFVAYGRYAIAPLV